MGGQRDHLKWTRGRLQLTLAAALFGGIAALLTEVRPLRDKPEERWYNGRAPTGSVKTPTWRRTAGAEPLNPG
ncbi:hypothetical protein [Streptomyces sp. NPDC057280]|uniref:hypothetical protein n=1 Tax=Streptomyces sp. NPDC057280 TaxID=3346081 RepID=UPI0036326A2C